MNGKTLGHYRVGDPLGRGGMGEVYAADDLNLSRKVALKFLSEPFAGDPERMARFEREARLLASLNHPNIAAIYGLEQAEGKRFIVMELVEGETLAQRISKGALPVEESLAICRQIAEGLEAAHEKGVIHRDLKPANVMITEGERVKILDFGLAKALSDDTQNVDSSQSPTLTEAMTRPGVILGTAAYMSPEQAKGKTVDKRADIWAFGCILHECLTGKRAFEGETVTETLAAVLTRDPEWEKIPANAQNLLRRCLEKDPKKRLRDIGDAFALLDIIPGAVSPKHSWLWISIAAVFIGAFAALSFIHFGKKAVTSAESMRLQIEFPETANPSSGGGTFALSPDGRRLAFAATGSDRVARIWLREINSLDAKPLQGTESEGHPPFFWSPDSRFIAFDAGGKLKKVDVAGGLPLTICDLSTKLLGGSWSRDGEIIFGTYVGCLMRVPAEGGTASPLTELNSLRQERQHAYPSFLSDGRHFFYWCNSRIIENRGVYIGSLDERAEKRHLEPVARSLLSPVYVRSQDSGPGYLLYSHQGTLVCQRYDERRLERMGEPVPLAEQVGSFGSFSLFSASTNGILVYRNARSGQMNRAVWFDRKGKVLGGKGEGAGYGLAYSPDGEQAAVGLYNPAESFPGVDIWMLHFSRDTKERFTFGQVSNYAPVWSQDGSEIFFASNRDGGVANLYRKAASGTGEEKLLLKSNNNNFPSSCSRDGRFLLYTAEDPKTRGDLWILPLKADSRPFEFLRTVFSETDAHFSPDMRWVAYVSDKSGCNEVYVCTFSQDSGSTASEPQREWMISSGGGTAPRWRGDGKELYYRALNGAVMAVKTAASGAFDPQTPEALFQAPGDLKLVPTALSLSFWDVTADGSRFLLAAPSEEGSPAPFNVILNWTALLKK